jgi:hypothetical protein
MGAAVAVGRGRPRRDDAGTGLVEVVIAMLVLLTVLVPTTSLIETTVQQAALTKQRVAAAEMAEQGLEQISNYPLSTLEADLNNPSVLLGTATVGGVTYTADGFISWLGAGSTPDLCQAGSPPQVMAATATVSWGKNNELAESTVINPPYSQAVFYLANALTSGHTYTSLTATTNQTIASGSSLTVGADTSQTQTITVSSAVSNSTTIPVTSFTAAYSFSANTTPVALPGEGYLAVQVNGASGSGPPSDVSDVTVTVTQGATSTTYYPDNTGCVYEQELPGNYNVTLGTATGFTPPFVDPSESQAPTTATPETVTANTTVSWPWSFDQSDVTSFASSGSVPVAGGAPVSVFNSHMPGVHWTTVIGAGSGAASADLYPFTSTYTGVWYGDCLDEQPLSPSTLTATPAGTSVVAVNGLGTLDVETLKSSVPFAGATVTATMVNNDTSCTNNDTLTLPVTNGSGISQAGVIMDTRTDTGVTVTSGSHTVTDPSLLSTDAGKLVVGTGIPSNAYVYGVSGTSFTLSSSPVTSTPLTATATSASLSLVGEKYSVTATDTGTHQSTTVSNLMVNPNGIVQGSNFLSGTAVTVSVL